MRANIVNCMDDIVHQEQTDLPSVDLNPKRKIGIKLIKGSKVLPLEVQYLGHLTRHLTRHPSQFVPHSSMFFDGRSQGRDQLVDVRFFDNKSRGQNQSFTRWANHDAIVEALHKNVERALSRDAVNT